MDEMLDELLSDCQSPEDSLGESGLLKQLNKRLIERALAGELNHHLKSKQENELDPPTSENPSRGNSRNGYSKKTIQSDHGEMDLAIPRDRKGEFEPVLVPKHQRRLAGLDEKILVLYARGMSTRDISAQLEELYGGVGKHSGKKGPFGLKAKHSRQSSFETASSQEHSSAGVP